MKAAVLFFATCVTLASLFVSGCSLAVFVRVFNATDHAIKLLMGPDGEAVTIPAGESARVMIASVTRGRNHGFAIEDAGVERFYVVYSHSEDGALMYATSLAFPKVSRKPKTMAPEYLVEYATDSTISALDASKEKNPQRLNPQPAGFPIKPNQSSATVFRKHR
jgi:hypothetical protein